MIYNMIFYYIINEILYICIKYISNIYQICIKYISNMNQIWINYVSNMYQICIKYESIINQVLRANHPITKVVCSLVAFVLSHNIVELTLEYNMARPATVTDGQPGAPFGCRFWCIILSKGNNLYKGIVHWYSAHYA